MISFDSAQDHSHAQEGSAKDRSNVIERICVKEEIAIHRFCLLLMCCLVLFSLHPAAEASQSHRITINSFMGGSTSPSGSHTVLDGGSFMVSITPDSGYEIGTITVDGLSVGVSNSYMFSNVKTDHVLTVTFKQKPPPPAAPMQNR